MTNLKGKTLTDYAIGAIAKLDSYIERSTSETRIEKLTERRDYWIAQYEKETGKKYGDDIIRTKDDLADLGLPVFEVSEMPEILELMRKYEKPETD